MIQNTLELVRELTHKMYDENDTIYLDEIENIDKKLYRLSVLLRLFLAIGIIICPISYIVEKIY